MVKSWGFLLVTLWLRILHFLRSIAISEIDINLLEELQDFELSKSAENASFLRSPIPNLVSMKFQNQHFPFQYSYTEWEWSSFRSLLKSSVGLCRRNETFFTQWTLPVKCEYYIIIRALRAAKNEEVTLNEKERSLISAYVDEIYGKREDYERIKERLKHPLLERDKREKALRLRTVLESNKLDHLLSHRYFVEADILEACSTPQDFENIENPSEGSPQPPNSSLSVAFLLYLPLSSILEFHHTFDLSESTISPTGTTSGVFLQSLKISRLPFFQTFVKSFLKYISETRTESDSAFRADPTLLYSLYVAYDERIDQELFPTFSLRFRKLCEELLPIFHRVEMISLGEDLRRSFDRLSIDHYDYRQVLERDESQFYFFPFPYQRLLQASMRHGCDYFFFINENTTIGDVSFFEKTIHDLRLRNHLLPDFGLYVDLNDDRNELIVLHRSHFVAMRDFPLSANVLNNSYLNHHNSSLMWNHLYFTLVDIYSVFQPFLRWNNEFLRHNAVNYSTITNYAQAGRHVFSPQFAVGVEKYKVLVERARRHLAKWLYRDERYTLYHSCVNDVVNQRLDPTKLSEMFSETLLTEAKEYFHPIQFYWRPNQLLYEVNGIFSAVNF